MGLFGYLNLYINCNAVANVKDAEDYGDVRALGIGDTGNCLSWGCEHLANVEGYFGAFAK
jgi:hypothetical protein